MFSIAAINDTDSKSTWEPLAPTKEAQEFHLTQSYHEGLQKLQAKEYDKARELLEAVLKDPMISSAQVESTAGDSHLLQLKFLALKNLASVFLQQGSDHHESALKCYLQAVEIDTKDSVVWNKLGTLACSMGILNICRWAFEQGLACSPNNWNCMEKLLEVLIAIGDEVACLSVAELILRHWPTHARALHVKRTIEDPEPVPFAPKGIDKLEPKHVRLTFGKRKASDSNLEEGSSTKRVNHSIQLQLTEVSWVAVASSILGILLRQDGCDSVKEDEKYHHSRNTRIEICLPSNCGDAENSNIICGQNNSVGECSSIEESNGIKKDAHYSEEQIHERRSSRLERMRSQKTGKEDREFSGVKDMEKVVIRFLQPFVISGLQDKDFDHSSECSPVNEWLDVQNFVLRVSKNQGADHLGHMLLEEVANRDVVHCDGFRDFLELEKLTRSCGWDRTPECSLFLAELYHDFGSCLSDSSRMSDYMHEAVYHIAKIIESVLLDRSTGLGAKGVESGSVSSLERPKSFFEGPILTEKSSFWVRYYWISGLVSIWEGNRDRAHKELSISSSLLENNRNLNDIPGSIQLPHCKVNKELTTHKIRHVINLLQVQFLLENDVAELLEEDTFECINLLAPRLLSGKGVYVDFSRITDKHDAFATGELTALRVLVKACEKANPLNIEVYLKSQKRKLQILMVAAGMEDLVASCELFCEKSVPNIIFVPGTEPKDDSGRHCFDSVAEQVKEISECVSRVKNCIGQVKDSNDIAVPRSIIADIQTLLLALMCNIAKMCFSKKASGVLSPDQTEQEQRCLFVNASIAFCKLQHLDLTIPIKAQVELIVAIHDVLAEYGLCCFGKNGEGVDGTFLKLAIKHLLALDMKLKSICPLSKETEENLSISQIKDDSKMSSDGMGVDMCLTDIVVPDSLSPSDSEHEKDPEELPSTKFIDEEDPSKQITNTRTALGEQEREELESGIDDALNQCFFCLYGLNLRSDSTYEDDLSVHQNTSQADYQSKEQCADVFTYILPYAKASTKSGLLKLRKVLRAIHKHFPQPPDDVLAGNPIDKYLDDPTLCEDKLSEKTGSDGYLESIVKVMYPDTAISNLNKISLGSCEPYMDVYSNLYYLLAQSEETSAIDKRPGFVLTKEGEDFMEQSAKLSKFDLLFNPLRFESWQRLANIYDEEVDLLLNDGSKNLNVAGWRKNASLPERVEASRRRSRRCLLMSLALAKTPEQQSEIHELLALVYYDSVQNAVPFYDQRSIAPLKDSTWMMFCKNSMKHFEKAFAHRQDWSHAFYLGKLCEKLGCPPDVSFSYYSKAIVLNPSSVDAIYRMHASRLKLLYTTSQRKNVETLKVCASYSFDQTTKDTALTVLDGVQRRQLLKDDGNDTKIHDLGGQNDEQSDHLDNVWHMLYSDCLSGLEICVEGDLKHFHKARYRIAQGLYRRGDIGDLELAKNEISFCFKSSRSSFTINMWEIDSTAKKGRRKIPIVSGSKKLLEVNLPESSRKFITCIRKYLLFYLRLLEETGDISTLDRAYVSIRTDKRFSLCLEDMVPVSLGRYLKALIISLSTRDDVSSTLAKNSQQILEKMFNLFMEQGSIWPDMCSSPDIKCPELRESTLYGYLHQYLYSLEKDVKLEVLEGMNEKIRKRSKNPKLSNSFCVGVFKHASVAWCRSLIVNLVLVTPLNSSSITDPNADLDNNHLLCIDLQTSEFWNSSFGDASHLSNLETKWDSVLSKVKYVLVKKASEENLDTANSLLRSAYSFYRDSSSIVLTSGINLFWVPSRLATTGQFHPSTDGVEIVDISIPRKLLLWAYTLLHGRCPGISAVVKYCEENFKSKMKKTSAGLSSSSASLPTVPAAQSVAAVSKDRILGSYDPAVVGSSSSMPETISIPGLNIAPLTNNSQKILSTDQQLHHCNNAVSEKRTFDLNDDAEPERT